MESNIYILIAVTETENRLVVIRGWGWGMGGMDEGGQKTLTSNYR